MPILKTVAWIWGLHFTDSNSGLRNQALLFYWCSSEFSHSCSNSLKFLSSELTVWHVHIKLYFFLFVSWWQCLWMNWWVKILLRNCAATLSARVQAVHAIALFCREFICGMCCHYQKYKLQLSKTLTQGPKRLAKSKTLERKRSEWTSEQGVLLPLMECAFISFQSCGKQLLKNL